MVLYQFIWGKKINVIQPCLSLQPRVSFEGPGQLPALAKPGDQLWGGMMSRSIQLTQHNQRGRMQMSLRTVSRVVMSRIKRRTSLRCNNWNKPKSIHCSSFFGKSSYFCFVSYQKEIQYISYPIKHTYNFCGNKTQERHKYSQGFPQFRRTL